MAEISGLDIPPEIDSPVTVEVDATIASEEGFISAVAQYSGGTAEVEIEEPEPKKFTLVLQPPRPDKYTLEVRWGPNHVYGRPLFLDLRPPNAKAVTIAEPPAGKLAPGQPIKICFATSNAGRGEMTCTCSGEDVGEIRTDVERRDFTNKFDAKFIPPHEEEYVVHVKWGERSVKGSPFKIDLIPVNPGKVMASVPKVPANPDDPIEINISTKGAGNDKLTAACVGTKCGKIPVLLKKIATHDYHLTVAPPMRDTISISLMYAGKHIPNSPFLINTLPKNAQGNKQH